MKKSKPTSPTPKPKSPAPPCRRRRKESLTDPQLHKHCALTLTTIKRSQITDWPGAPLHELTIHARARLKASIRLSTLVLPLLWNKQTGHLVDGHQRLALLDELAGRHPLPGGEGRGEGEPKDYLLQVVPLDISRDAELRLALVLNNPSAMAAWHIPGLEAAVRELKGDIEATGFDHVELQVLCDSDEMAGIFAVAKDHHKSTAAELEGIKKRRAEAKLKNQEKDQTEFYTVLVFKNNAELEAFYQKAQLDLSQKYHDGRKVAELI
jgi:hypothetical protein